MKTAANISKRKHTISNPKEIPPFPTLRYFSAYIANVTSRQTARKIRNKNQIKYNQGFHQLRGNRIHKKESKTKGN